MINERDRTCIGLGLCCPCVTTESATTFCRPYAASDRFAVHVLFQFSIRCKRQCGMVEKTKGTRTVMNDGGSDRCHNSKIVEYSSADARHQINLCEVIVLIQEKKLNWGENPGNPWVATSWRFVRLRTYQFVPLFVLIWNRLKPDPRKRTRSLRWVSIWPPASVDPSCAFGFFFFWGGGQYMNWPRYACLTKMLTNLKQQHHPHHRCRRWNRYHRALNGCRIYLVVPLLCSTNFINPEFDFEQQWSRRNE